MILRADGQAYKAPVELTNEEMWYARRVFGIKEHVHTPPSELRNRWSLGRYPKRKDARAPLIQGLVDRGMAELVLDGSRLALARRWRGRIPEGETILRFLKYGLECFSYTVRLSAQRQSEARKAELEGIHEYRGEVQTSLS